MDGTPVAVQGGTVPASSAEAQEISATVSLSAGQTVGLIVTAGNGAVAYSGCGPVGATSRTIWSATMA